MSTPKSQRRAGKFLVQAHFIENWEELLPILKDVVVTRCELRWDTKCFHYSGLSKKFRALEEWEAPPEYEPILTKHPNGKVTAVWKEKAKP